MPNKKATSSNNAQIDALSGEVTFRAQLDEKGLTVGGKSRALAAFDRLLGGVLGIPAEWFEGIRRRAELKGEARNQFIKSQIIQENTRLSSMGDSSQVITQRLAAEEVRKQINREAVLIQTIEVIQDVSEPTDSNLSQSSETIEEDWINVFAAYAEKASSERMQQLWGRILSGEIRKPGSFSLSTLRIISEMDAEIATSFQRIAALRFNDGLLAKPKIFLGPMLVEWTNLEEFGLLQDVNGSLGLKKDEKGATYEEPKRTALVRTKNYGIVLTFVHDVPSLHVPIVKITRVGQQIANILPWDEIGALRAIAVTIDSNVGIDIVSIVSSNDINIEYQVFENVKPAPTRPNVPTDLHKK